MSCRSFAIPARHRYTAAAGLEPLLAATRDPGVDRQRLFAGVAHRFGERQRARNATRRAIAAPTAARVTALDAR